MKQIKINPNQITITYTTKKQATKLHNWISHNQLLKNKDCKIENNTVTYNISNYKNKFTPLIRIIHKIVYDTEYLSKELYSSAFSTDIYNYRLNLQINPNHNKLFRITPIKEDGTLGLLDFGVHQYTTFISFIQTNNPREFVLLSSKGHVNKDNPNQLKYEKGFENGSILIEIGEIQF